jgi:DNA-binding ferritin-like protein
MPQTTPTYSPQQRPQQSVQTAAATMAWDASVSPLDQQSTGTISEKFNVLQASVQALLIKTRGFTFNIVSKDFYEFHTLFNLHIEYLQKAIYEIGERIRSLGPVAAVTGVREVQALSQVRDAVPGITDPAVMVSDLLADYATLSSIARGIFKDAAAVGDAGTIALITRTTMQLEHFQWELRVMTQRYQW